MSSAEKENKTQETEEEVISSTSSKPRLYEDKQQEKICVEEDQHEDNHNDHIPNYLKGVTHRLPRASKEQ